MNVTSGFTAGYETIPSTSYLTGTAIIDSNSPGSTNRCLLYTFIVYCVIGSSLVLAGLVGNTLTMIILGREKTKSATIFLLRCLIISDSIVLIANGVMTIPGQVAAMFGDKILAKSIGSVSYVYIMCFTDIAIMIKTWLTVTVTWHRNVNVCLPFKAKVWGSLRVAKRQLISIVLLSVLFNIPAFFDKRVILDYPRARMVAFAHSDLWKSRLYQIVYKSYLSSGSFF